MKPLHPTLLTLSTALLLGAFARGAEPESGAPSASELAARLSARQQDGASYVRLRMEIGAPRKAAVQIQIKSRAARGGTEQVYQVLWPKERKGEALLLRKSGKAAATGVRFEPPATTRPLASAQMAEPFFGSSLSYEDMIENFFAWDGQAIAGSEPVGRVECVILESKPGKADHSSYSHVRTWVDTRSMVPMRIEKYSGPGRLVRRIETTQVATDDQGHAIPANLTVQGPGGLVTEIDGSKIRHGVNFADEEFTPEGIKVTALPRGNAE